MQGFGDVNQQVETVAAPQPLTMDAVPMLALHVSPIRVCSHTPQSVPMLTPRTAALVHDCIPLSNAAGASYAGAAGSTLAISATHVASAGRQRARRQRTESSREPGRAWDGEHLQ